MNPLATADTPQSSASLTRSFRDPAGSLFPLNGRIYRIITEAGAADLDAFLRSPSAPKMFDAGTVVRTTQLNDADTKALLANPDVAELYQHIGGKMIVEHERVTFPSFPYEWPPEMLHEAGLLTIDLARQLLRDNIGLKDGTPYNVLFRGPNPIFIDVLSFERRDPRDPTWLPYAQFVRTFILPLLANRHFSMPLDQVLTVRRDGLEPEDVYRWTGPLQKLHPRFFSLVTLPAWLGAKHNQDDTSIYEKKLLDDPEKAKFILESLLNRVHRSIVKLAPNTGRSSVWSTYMEFNNNYTEEHFNRKQAFVSEALSEFKPRAVLDVGCNTGHFSALAARAGSSVVAVDYDPVVIGNVWRCARAEKLDILPLVVNLTRPTPGIGWLNRECSSFLERARGSFDAVFMLALIHHLMVSERIPLPDIIDLASELTRNILVIEFIAPEDSMFRRLTRGRDELHKGLTVDVFEQCARRRFDIVRSQHVEGSSRWLYLLKKRQ